uniref:MhOR5 n=1 Tax=Machilis hrabei TaxID=438506 RepID=UPI001C68732E|nr:Chain A, MhOR5 [Machilis hrabei]7LIC_B Chain B, MhOR5 [Machilis hrabei]7LIC_C Chain C, MhOR5 [Machilis hrabei]7LIC_D Chain D, MhOR5 [Machilis hrabei]7LID_A Chain A, MhOR5 [Machilis hrabei]7LID_B Chain B, MhOR5 [Machilis hrabei]7LID_C Chain C, MhOR5 [Machilis hrabei]7LID_D Chain D, MhOR5 [Machilis hrabei]7LIG_A Chain A, MhOR5 [Machilis hrabei]7LIG_B Chain B, MhOR5 [Machilis hrabei]7LIG_C Chain C, MhOR5 [Machilis hrabei]7LIG_D Chain D, MhOR5 [Machilis hrabei]
GPGRAKIDVDSVDHTDDYIHLRKWIKRIGIILRISGHWPFRLPHEKRNQHKSKFRQVYSCLVITLGFITCSCYCIGLCLSESIAQALNNITVTSYFLQSCVCYVSFIINSRKLETLFNYLFENEVVGCPRGYKMSSIKTTLFRCKFVAFSLGILSFFGWLMWTLLPLAVLVVDSGATGGGNQTSLRFVEAWYPFDTTTSPMNEVIAIYEAVAMIFLITAPMSSDIMFCVLMIFIVEHLKCLGMAIECTLKGISTNQHQNIGFDDSVSDVNVQRRIVIGKESPIQSIHVPIKECSRQSSDAVFREKRHGTHHQIIRSHNYTDATSLCNIVDSHVKIYRTMEIVQSVYSSYFATLFFTSCLAVCALAYFLAATSTSFTRVPGMVLYLMYIFLRIFLLCLLATEVAEQGLNLCHAGYSSKLVLASDHVRSTIQAIATRAQIPLSITGARFFTVNLSFLASMAGVMLTYFIVLLQVNAKPKP